MKFQVGEQVYVDYDNWSWRGKIVEVLPDGLPGNPGVPCYRIEVFDTGHGETLVWLGYETNTYSAAEVDEREKHER